MMSVDSDARTAWQRARRAARSGDLDTLTDALLDIDPASWEGIRARLAEVGISPADLLTDPRLWTPALDQTPPTPQTEAGAAPVRAASLFAV